LLFVNTSDQRHSRFPVLLGQTEGSICPTELPEQEGVGAVTVVGDMRSPFLRPAAPHPESQRQGLNPSHCSSGGHGPHFWEPLPTPQRQHFTIEDRTETSQLRRPDTPIPGGRVTGRRCRG
jgi:hypothetical protein